MNVRSSPRLGNSSPPCLAFASLSRSSVAPCLSMSSCSSTPSLAMSHHVQHAVSRSATPNARTPFSRTPKARTPFSRTPKALTPFSRTPNALTPSRARQTRARLSRGRQTRARISRARQTRARLSRARQTCARRTMYEGRPQVHLHRHLVRLPDPQRRDRLYIGLFAFFWPLPSSAPVRHPSESCFSTRLQTTPLGPAPAILLGQRPLAISSRAPCITSPFTSRNKPLALSSSPRCAH
jgi:hypothetical protein